MSLFGDDTDAPAQRQKSSGLFGDNSTTAGTTNRNSSSGMFDDSNTSAVANDDSPWGFTPTKKNAGRGSLVKNLLAGADVPDLYVDAFDAMQMGGRLTAQDCQKFLREAVPSAAADKTWNIVSSNGQATEIGRNEFNVLLALIGLAQEGEELSLDAVDERRLKLPTPTLPQSATKKAQPPAQRAPATPQTQPGAQRNGHLQESAFASNIAAESDPWGSPQMQRGHGHLNGTPQRTTSTFTTSATDPSDSVTGGSFDGGRPLQSDSQAPWGGSSSTIGGEGGFGGSDAPGDGFGNGSGGAGQGTIRKPAAPRPTISRGQEEVITVNLLEEKEGMFMFQHRNYEVASVRRNSKVIRRYSDFVWLLDCLHKRYPFRQLPLLPPKRVAINGNHIAADQTFLEKRRRGLARFANALVRHPVLREEQLVVMFLTVPTELAVWRKQATISVQEEFTGKPLPPGLEDSLPQNLQDTFDTVRSGVRRSADLYINLCNVTERLCKRKEAIAGEYSRFSMTLTGLTEATADTYAIDTNDVPLLNEGLKGTAKHIGTSQNLVEDEARAWDEGLLEDLKTMRDALVSMREMFDRRDRLARDNIPQLERRIQQNEQKLQGIKAKGEAAKPGEAEKVENAIIADKQGIVNQHARGVFIKECVRDEILFFNTTQYYISRMHQDWAQERVKYAELQADNFRGMVDVVEGMPLGED